MKNKELKDIDHVKIANVAHEQNQDTPTVDVIEASESLADKEVPKSI